MALHWQVVRPRVSETTSLGAAYAAGLAVGFWSRYVHLHVALLTFDAHMQTFVDFTDFVLRAPFAVWTNYARSGKQTARGHQYVI